MGEEHVPQGSLVNCVATDEVDLFLGLKKTVYGAWNNEENTLFFPLGSSGGSLQIYFIFIHQLLSFHCTFSTSFIFS